MIWVSVLGILGWSISAMLGVIGLLVGNYDVATIGAVFMGIYIPAALERGK